MPAKKPTPKPKKPPLTPEERKRQKNTKSVSLNKQLEQAGQQLSKPQNSFDLIPENLIFEAIQKAGGSMVRLYDILCGAKEILGRPKSDLPVKGVLEKAGYWGGFSFGTLKNNIKRNPKYEEAYKESREQCHGFMENQMIALANMGDPQAAKMMLPVLAKEIGNPYYETKTDVSDGQDVAFTAKVTYLSDDLLDRIKAEKAKDIENS
jgi:hypothetical protein